MAEEESEEVAQEAPDVFRPTVAFVRSDTIARIAPALLAAQKRLKNPEKNALNPHFKNHYADLGASMDAAKEACNAEDIAIIQTFAPTAYGHVGVTTIAVHKSGEYIGGTCVIPLDRDNAQGYGSAATYARRYSVQALVGMVAEDDDDGNAASRSEAKRPASNGPTNVNKSPKKGIFGQR